MLDVIGQGGESLPVFVYLLTKMPTNMTMSELEKIKNDRLKDLEDAYAGFDTAPEEEKVQWAMKCWLRRSLYISAAVRYALGVGNEVATKPK